MRAVDIGKASIKHVEKSMNKDFSHIFGDELGNNINYILNDVDWYESPGNRQEVYPVLIIEPILKDTFNNIVCLVPPFNKRYFE